MKESKTIKDNMVLMISVPFISLMLPSQQFASILAYLRENGVQARTEFPSYEYRYGIGEDAYEYLQKDDNGNELFGELLCGEIEKHAGANYPYELYRKTVEFVESFASRIGEYEYDHIIIHMQYSQLVPGLYFAKTISEKSGARIVLSGFHCEGILGENLKEIFPFIDETIGMDFEEELLAHIKNRNPRYNDTLDYLPSPDYEDAVNKLSQLKEEGLDVNVHALGYLVEFSRGCGWNKCSFCTLNCHEKSFRIRSKKKIAEDYRKLHEKYKTNVIIPEHFTMPENWKEQLSGIKSFTKNTSRNLVLNFKVVDLQREETLMHLHEMGASVLIGTESFSGDYLLKLNKGQRVIENIQALKYAERWDVPCFHNLMYSLPFETRRHLEENKKVFEYIYHLQPPFDVEKFRLTFGSVIFNNKEKYGIKCAVKQKRVYRCFSPDIADRYIPFFMTLKELTIVTSMKKIGTKRWIDGDTDIIASTKHQNHSVKNFW